MFIPQQCDSKIEKEYTVFSGRGDAVWFEGNRDFSNEMEIVPFHGSEWKVSFNKNPAKVHNNSRCSCKYYVLSDVQICKGEVDSKPLDHHDFPIRCPVFVDRVPPTGISNTPQLQIKGLGPAFTFDNILKPGELLNIVQERNI